MDISIPGWLYEFGYLAILVGTCLEGDTVLIAGGAVAQQNYLHLSGVMIAAFFGALTGDIAIFSAGRFWGKPLLVGRPRWQQGVDRVNHYLSRYPVAIIIVLRFLPGLRTPGLLALGIAHVPFAKFIAIELLSVSLWSIIVGSIGWSMGYGIDRLIANPDKLELILITTVILISSLILYLRLHGRGNLSRLSNYRQQG